MEKIVEINKDKILNRFTKGKSNEYYETITEVAKFMEEPELQGKWMQKCAGIKPNNLRDWIKQATREESEGFSRQLLFNSYKKKFKQK